MPKQQFTSILYYLSQHHERYPGYKKIEYIRNNTMFTKRDLQIVSTIFDRFKKLHPLGDMSKDFTEADLSSSAYKLALSLANYIHGGYVYHWSNTYREPVTDLPYTFQ